MEKSTNLAEAKHACKMFIEDRVTPLCLVQNIERIYKKEFKEIREAVK